MIKSFRSAFNVSWTVFLLVILLEDATHWLILHRIFAFAGRKLRYVMHGFCFAIGHFVYSRDAFFALTQGNRKCLVKFWTMFAMGCFHLWIFETWGLLVQCAQHILWDMLLRVLVNRLDKIAAERQRQRFARELNPAVLAFFAEKKE
jgi:hypothetical protein